MLDVYKKIILNVKEKTNNEQDKIYALNEEELFEYLWSVILVKSETDCLYHYIGKPMIKNLVIKIKKGNPPQNLGAYIVGMAKKERDKQEQPESEQEISKKKKHYWWVD